MKHEDFANLKYGDEVRVKSFEQLRNEFHFCSSDGSLSICDGWIYTSSIKNLVGKILTIRESRIPSHAPKCLGEYLALGKFQDGSHCSFFLIPEILEDVERVTIPIQSLEDLF